jgi:hypothetical protein
MVRLLKGWDGAVAQYVLTSQRYDARALRDRPIAFRRTPVAAARR